MNVKAIKQAAEDGDYEKALAACAGLLEQAVVDRVDVLRTRAYVLTLKGDYQSALRDRKEVLSGSQAELSDFYHAGECALNARQFAEAATLFKQLLKLGDEAGETWFRSASLIYLAYAQKNLGHFSEALKNLAAAISQDPNCAMPIPGRPGMCTAAELRNEIQRLTQ